MKPRNRFALGTLVADTVSVIVAGALASLNVYRTPLPWQPGSFPGQSARTMVALLVVGVAVGSWQSVRLVQPAVPHPLYVRAFTTAGIALTTVALGLVAIRPYYSQRWIGLTLGGWFVLALAHRAIRRRGSWVENMVIVSDEKSLIEDLTESRNARVLDVFEPRGEAPGSALPANTTLVVDLRAVMSDSMASFISSSTLAGYEVRALSNIYEEHLGRIALVHLAEGWEISVPLERRAPYAPFKRVVESMLVILTAPLWILLGVVTWAAIKLDSRGPAIFRQQRTGFDDRPFMMYKFRTMVLGADDDGPQFTAPDDPRITKIGRVLRMTRLDEIPQLINVLQGDTALVGPRAEQVAFADDFEKLIPFYRYRHLVRPGITGWAQVHSGYADDVNDTIEKLTYDLYYVRHMSPWLDLSILGKTIATVLKRSGAQ